LYDCSDQAGARHWVVRGQAYLRRGHRPGPATDVHSEPSALDPAAADYLDGFLEQGVDGVQLGESSRQHVDPPKSEPLGSPFTTRDNHLSTLLRSAAEGNQQD
jgi:hypothetical protein